MAARAITAIGITIIIVDIVRIGTDATALTAIIRSGNNERNENASLPGLTRQSIK
jgi:hypothetical protein